MCKSLVEVLEEEALVGKVHRVVIMTLSKVSSLL